LGVGEEGERTSGVLVGLGLPFARFEKKIIIPKHCTSVLLFYE